MTGEERIQKLEEDVKSLRHLLNVIAEHLDAGGSLGVQGIPAAKLISRVKKLEEQVKRLQVAERTP